MFRLLLVCSETTTSFIESMGVMVRSIISIFIIESNSLWGSVGGSVGRSVGRSLWWTIGRTIGRASALVLRRKATIWKVPTTIITVCSGERIILCRINIVMLNLTQIGGKVNIIIPIDTLISLVLLLFPATLKLKLALSPCSIYIITT